MFSPSLLPSLAVSLSPPLTQFRCVHTRADELEGRRGGHATEAYSVGVLCVAARAECPALTRRRRERRLAAQGSCRPICPSFLRAGRPTDASSSQMSDGVFASNLGLLFFPFPPHVASKFSLPVSGPVPFLPRSHFPSLIVRDVSGVGGRSAVRTQGEHVQQGLLPTWCRVLGVRHWEFGEMQSAGLREVG